MTHLLFVKLEVEECPSLQGYPGGGHQPPGAPYGGNNPYGRHPSAPYAGQPSAGPYGAPGQGGPYAPGPRGPPAGPYGGYGGQPQGGYYGHHAPVGKYCRAAEEAGAPWRWTGLFWKWGDCRKAPIVLFHFFPSLLSHSVVEWWIENDSRSLTAMLRWGSVCVPQQDYMTGVMSWVILSEG